MGGMSSLRRFEPAVDKKVLYAVAAVVWSAVGLMMCGLAASWLALLPWLEDAGVAAAGLMVAILAAVFLFSRVARRNIARIEGKRERVCVFAFQAWRGYVLVAFMIALGLALRHSPLPRPLLAFLYLGIGGGLLGGSVRYYRRALSP
ncbi:MAG: hypothetical protein PHU25_14305 [Deltaproteobacteria bacterium]|nr:hypothetical protein [Deltaproteobacteria bacterium]